MKTSIVLMALFFFVVRTEAQVPLYNSYPQAQAVLFLDFDGHVVSGTNWNLDGPIYCGPSGLKPEQMTEVYNRIAEDYRPFNINVTTDSAVYEAAPITQRMRVLFTITSDWYGVAGGVAYTNSFSWGNNTPCFVFTALHKYNVKNIAEAGAHEAGHTLGLRHQAVYDSTCKKVSDYNSGVGSGIAGWAPIMGVGYYRNTTTWHFGPNPYGCTNEQDDLSIITSERNGFGYRTDDDTSATFAEALPINADTNQLSGNGLISTNQDVDLFQFTMPATGPVALNVTPYSIAPNDEGSNLDVQVQLYNKTQTLVGTYNPSNKLSVAIDTTLASGTYYVAVSGASGPYASSYASLGSYTISGSVPELSALPLRSLQLRGSATEGTHKLNWAIDADEAVVTQVLERSENGAPFTPIATLSAASRSFSGAYSGAAQYRLQVTFDNGKSHYSNVLQLQSRTTAAKPQLYTNVIHTNTLQVSSPEACRYAITNTAGQVLQTGVVPSGTSTITMGVLKSGVYLISFQTGSQRVTQKFVRD